MVARQLTLGLSSWPDGLHPKPDGVQTAPHRVQTGSYRVQMVPHRVQAGSYRVQAVAHRVQAGSYRVQLVPHRVQAGSYRVQADVYRVQGSRCARVLPAVIHSSYAGCCWRASQTRASNSLNDSRQVFSTVPYPSHRLEARRQRVADARQHGASSTGSDSMTSFRTRPTRRVPMREHQKVWGNRVERMPTGLSPTVVVNPVTATAPHFLMLSQADGLRAGAHHVHAAGQPGRQPGAMLPHRYPVPAAAQYPKPSARPSEKLVLSTRTGRFSGGLKPSSSCGSVLNGEGVPVCLPA